MTMILCHHLPIQPVNIPGKVNDTTLADLFEIYARNIGPLHCPVGFFHRQVDDRRDAGQRRIREWLAALYVDLPCTSNDVFGVFKASEQRVRTSLAGVAFDAEIRVLDWAVAASFEGRAEQICESEVRPALSPFRV